MKTKIVPENRLKCIEIALLIGLAVFLISGGLALRTQTGWRTGWCGFTCWPTPMARRTRP